MKYLVYSIHNQSLISINGFFMHGSRTQKDEPCSHRTGSIPIPITWTQLRYVVCAITIILGCAWRFANFLGLASCIFQKIICAQPADPCSVIPIPGLKSTTVTEVFLLCKQYNTYHTIINHEILM